MAEIGATVAVTAGQYEGRQGKVVSKTTTGCRLRMADGDRRLTGVIAWSRLVAEAASANTAASEMPPSPMAAFTVQQGPSRLSIGPAATLRFIHAAVREQAAG